MEVAVGAGVAVGKGVLVGTGVDVGVEVGDADVSGVGVSTTADGATTVGWLASGVGEGSPHPTRSSMPTIIVM